MKHLKSSVLIIVAFISGSLISLFTTLALAHGGDTNLIHACVRNTLLPNASNIRIVGENTNCNSNETALDWPKTAGSGGGSSETPISVGGGLSGRWEGTFTIPPSEACTFSDNLETQSFTVNFVQDSAGNLSGASKTQYDSNSDRPASVVYGRQDQSDIEFEMGEYNLTFSVTAQDTNNISGTVIYDKDPDGCNLPGTWSAQRAPLL